MSLPVNDLNSPQEDLIKLTFLSYCTTLFDIRFLVFSIGFASKRVFSNERVILIK